MFYQNFQECDNLPDPTPRMIWHAARAMLGLMKEILEA